MRRLALFTAFVVCASQAYAQETSRTPAQGPIAESAERIARELWRTDAAPFSVDEEGRPRFRTGVTETLSPPPWQPAQDLSLTPVRGAISHKEMLRMMTPQEFSTPLISATVDPGDVYNDFRRAWRDWQARRIRARVTRELEELERLRAADEASTLQLACVEAIRGNCRARIRRFQRETTLPTAPTQASPGVKP